MEKGSKKDKNDTSVKVIVLVTAVINLVRAVIEIIGRLTD